MISLYFSIFHETVHHVIAPLNTSLRNYGNSCFIFVRNHQQCLSYFCCWIKSLSQIQVWVRFQLRVANQGRWPDCIRIQTCKFHFGTSLFCPVNHCRSRLECRMRTHGSNKHNYCFARICKERQRSRSQSCTPKKRFFSSRLCNELLHQ